MRRFLTALVLVAATAAGADEMGDDGLFKADWMRDTFKDLQEDFADAKDEDKRLMVLVEQRGCSYCREMHEVTFADSRVADYMRDNYFVVQVNLHGATELTDTDGEALTERGAARKWGLLFTPTMMFLPTELDEFEVGGPAGRGGDAGRVLARHDAGFAHVGRRGAVPRPVRGGFSEVPRPHDPRAGRRRHALRRFAGTKVPPRTTHWDRRPGLPRRRRRPILFRLAV